MFSVCPEIEIQLLETKETRDANVTLYVLRLDQTDVVVSGNKWFKLKYNLKEVIDNPEYQSVLSFGGAYSNHIHALARAGYELGVDTIGIIRGEPEYAANPTLSDALEWGMRLQFVSRQEYRQRHNPDYLSELQAKFPRVCIIPEGGSNKLAVKGAMEIVTDEVLRAKGISHIVLPCGTGGTLAGVALSCPDTQVLGIPVLKNAAFLHEDIGNLMQASGYQPSSNWNLDFEGHYGGYAKINSRLSQFIEDMARENRLELDQVYTGKMLLRVLELIKQGYYEKGARVLAIHTGGLQGVRSRLAT